MNRWHFAPFANEMYTVSRLCVRAVRVHGLHWMHQREHGYGFMHSISLFRYYTVCKVHRVCVCICMSYAMWYDPFRWCLSWHVIRIYCSRFILASIIWFIIASISRFTCWYRIISRVLFRLCMHVYVYLFTPTHTYTTISVNTM